MDPDETASDEERRKEIRRAYNRLNAQRSRQRTKDRIKSLTEQCDSLENQETALLATQRQLQVELQRLHEENSVLRLAAGLPLQDLATHGVTTTSGSGSIGPGQLQQKHTPASSVGVEAQSVRSILRAQQEALLSSSSALNSGLHMPTSGNPLNAQLNHPLMNHLLGESLLNPRFSSSFSPTALGIAGGLRPQFLAENQQRLRELQMLSMLQGQDLADSMRAQMTDETKSDASAQLLEFWRQQHAREAARTQHQGLLHPESRRGKSPSPGPM